MNKAQRRPPLNSLRFLKANDVLPGNYNTWPFDRGFFYQQIRTFYQQNTDYVQKIDADDTVTIYIDSLCQPHINISIIDCYGKVIIAVATNLPYTDSMAGNVDSYFGDQYFTYIKQFTPSGLSLADGFYFCVIECLYAITGDPDNDLYVSECFQIRTGGFEKTMLIEYNNDVNNNDYDVIWAASTPAPWAFRAEMVMIIKPGSHTTAFEDMLFRDEKLQDVPFRVGTLTVGGEGGVPPWVLDKINRMLACDTFMIDGVQWFKTGSSKWTFKEAENYAMMAASIELVNDPANEGFEDNNSSDPSTFKIHDEVDDDVQD